MLKKFDETVEINHSLNWPYIPYHHYRILTIGGSGSGKTNLLLNLVKSLTTRYRAKFIYTSKINLNQSIKRKEKKGLKNEKTQKHSIDDDYKNLEDYNAARKRKVLIVFDDVIWKLIRN